MKLISKIMVPFVLATTTLMSTQAQSSEICDNLKNIGEHFCTSDFLDKVGKCTTDKCKDSGSQEFDSCLLKIEKELQICQRHPEIL